MFQQTARAWFCFAITVVVYCGLAKCGVTAGEHRRPNVLLIIEIRLSGSLSLRSWLGGNRWLSGALNLFMLGMESQATSRNQAVWIFP